MPKLLNQLTRIAIDDEAFGCLLEEAASRCQVKAAA